MFAQCIKNISKFAIQNEHNDCFVEKAHLKSYTFQQDTIVDFRNGHFTYFSLDTALTGARGGRIHVGCRRPERGEERGWREGRGCPECPEPSAAGQEQREGPGDRGQRRAVSTVADITDSNFELSPKARGHSRQLSTMIFELGFKRSSFTQILTRKHDFFFSQINNFSSFVTRKWN